MGPYRMCNPMFLLKSLVPVSVSSICWNDDLSKLPCVFSCWMSCLLLASADKSLRLELTRDMHGLISRLAFLVSHTEASQKVWSELIAA